MERSLRVTASPTIKCPRCGYVASNEVSLEAKLNRPWHLRSRTALKAYVKSVGAEEREWLLALYVDDDYGLLAAVTLAIGGILDCPVPMGGIYRHGLQLGAKAFFLVHNHPSGDPTPS